MSIPGRSTFLPVADRFRLRAAQFGDKGRLFELGDGAQACLTKQRSECLRQSAWAPTPR